LNPIHPKGNEKMKNKYLVCSLGNSIAIQAPPVIMTKQDAMELAAWLLAIAGATDDEFNLVQEAIFQSSDR